MTSIRFSLGIPVDRVDLPDEFLHPGAVQEMATSAERLGFAAAYVTDHPAPAHRWVTHGGHHALEPMVALSFVAAATTRLRVHTNLYVAAYRPALVGAKSLASLDVLSGGRLIVGVAAGYLEGEFAALGVPFDGRGDLLTERLEAWKAAWVGEPMRYPLEDPDAGLIQLLPRPLQRPHPPLWIGGNSRAALQRAVRHAQGWSPFANPGFARVTRTAEIASIDDLSGRIATLRTLCEEHGRAEPLDVCFTPFHLVARGAAFDAEELRDELGVLAELGVTWATVEFRAASRTEWLEHVQRFSEAVVHPR